jgi:Plasmid pRiA4b ORF-3-like protein
MADPPGQSTFQLKITLENIRPSIWRRVLVPGSIRLAKLHDIFQAAMGWTNSHLHCCRPVVCNERTSRGVRRRLELVHQERSGIAVAPGLGIDEERDPSVPAQLDRRGAVLQRPWAFENRPWQVEPDVQQPRPVLGEASFDGLVVPGVNPR